MSDAAALFDRGGFHEDDAGAALRELAEVDEVPVVGEPVGRGVLAHRRDDDPVAERHAA